MGKKKISFENIKIAIVCSSGGHLTHMMMLKPFWEKHNRFFVTFNKEDANSQLKDEKIYHCYYPTNRNFKNYIINKNGGKYMKYAYIRASTEKQNIDRQYALLSQYVDNNHIYIDKESGKDFNRKNYQKLKKILKNGDECILNLSID